MVVGQITGLDNVDLSQSSSLFHRLSDRFRVSEGELFPSWDLHRLAQCKVPSMILDIEIYSAGKDRVIRKWM